MKHTLTGGSLLLALAGLAAMAGRAGAQEHQHHTTGGPRIPESMRVEHAAIHEGLERATSAPGAVGEKARALAAVLHPHFVREEEIALPPLGLLAPLSRGEFEPSMRDVLPMTDALRSELPRMLAEHAVIGEAARALEQAAREAGNTEVEELARALQLHARSEEELFYPAAVLVGELVRARSK
jgi:hypothetical protein